MQKAAEREGGGGDFTVGWPTTGHCIEGGGEFYRGLTNHRPQHLEPTTWKIKKIKHTYLGRWLFHQNPRLPLQDAVDIHILELPVAFVINNICRFTQNNTRAQTQGKHILHDDQGKKNV